MVSQMKFPGAMLFVKQDTVFDTQCVFTGTDDADEDDEIPFRLTSRIQGSKGSAEEAGNWTVNAMGVFSQIPSDVDPPPTWDIQEALKDYPNKFTGEQFYEEMSNAGYQFGPEFALIDEMWRSDCGTKTIARLKVVSPKLVSSFYVYPIYVDCSLQMLFAQLSSLALTAPPTFL